MLAELDSYDDMTPEERMYRVNVRRWFNLLDDFRFLQLLVDVDMIGGSDKPQAIPIP